MSSSTFVSEADLRYLPPGPPGAITVVAKNTEATQRAASKKTQSVASRIWAWLKNLFSCCCPCLRGRVREGASSEQGDRGNGGTRISRNIMLYGKTSAMENENNAQPATNAAAAAGSGKVEDHLTEEQRQKFNLIQQKLDRATESSGQMLQSSTTFASNNRTLATQGLSNSETIEYLERVTLPGAKKILKNAKERYDEALSELNVQTKMTAPRDLSEAHWKKIYENRIKTAKKKVDLKIEGVRKAEAAIQKLEAEIATLRKKK